MPIAKPLRILIVDDSAYARQTLASILEQIPGVEICGKAFDGADAIPKILKLEPDLLTLDLEMPNMDGFAVLRWLSATRPTPAVVVSSLAEAPNVFRALELGAIDFVAKPRRGAGPELLGVKGDLERIVSGFSRLRLRGAPQARPAAGPPRAAEPAKPAEEGKPLAKSGTPELVIIGASTGGPAAVEEILVRLPADFPAPVLVVQHMPAGFTRLFADRLARRAAIAVMETRAGERLRPCRAYVCAGGVHTLVTKERYLDLVAPADRDRYVPSVDRAMSSAALACKDRLLGIVLTGMGDDGREGTRAIHAARGLTIAQSEESALVFGMPERAISAGAVDRVLGLQEIGDALLELASRAGKSGSLPPAGGTEYTR
ncbi:MAG: chemotaxis-specific protein-glutamate methyltransferase CheB [Acidobacteriota bacterium]